jgi:deferrochelatase/peroxidase EfeB
MVDPVSRSRREITEITHIAPVCGGLIPLDRRGPDSAPITYADRLKVILDTFQRREDGGFPNVIRMFRGIHTAQWSLIDGDTRLMLHVVFDGDWYDYLRSLAYEVPAFLNLIWSNCEGWEPVGDDPDKLFKFIKAYQTKVNYLYATNPDLTVRDIAWLKQLRSVVQSLPPDQRGLIYAKMDSKLATATFEDARIALLHDAGPDAVDKARVGFHRLFGRLYNAHDRTGAESEAFGPLPRAVAAPGRSAVEDDELQSNLYKGHPTAHCARMFFLQITDVEQARAWLRTLQHSITYGRKEHPLPTHLALSYEGLRLLAPDNASLETLPEAFRQGMQRRAKRLGDPALPAVAHEPRCARELWCPACHGASSVHAVLTVHVPISSEADPRLHAALVEAGERARAEPHATAERLRSGKADDHRCAIADLKQKLDQKLQKLASPVLQACAGVEVLGHQDLHRPLVPDGSGKYYGVEHFGFREGGAEKARREALLEQVVLDSKDPSLHRGSFMVIRQLEQKPSAFWDAMRGTGLASKLDAVRVGELVMGVERDGDRLGSCPMQAHVHRVNPHHDVGQARNPRMIRRGLPYRDGHDKPGLMFMAFVEDIEAQFEFVQRRWVQAGNHVGGTSQDRDVVAGMMPHDAPAGAPGSTFTTQPAVATHPSFNKLPPLAATFGPFVTLRWGDYFFVPSRRGLAALLRTEPPGAPTARHGSSHASSPSHAWFQVELDAKADDLDGQRDLVRTWLDEPKLATAFWQWVERRGGYKLGDWVFAAHPRDTYDAMSDDGTSFSVREYGRRMEPTTGRFFLGIDAVEDDYQRESRTAAIVPQGSEARTAIRERTLQFVTGFLQTAFVERVATLRIANGQEPARILVTELLARVLDRLASATFGMPGPSFASLAGWGGNIARAHFRVAADASDVGKVRQTAIEFRAHVEQMIRQALADEPDADAPDSSYEQARAQRDQLRHTLERMRRAWTDDASLTPVDAEQGAHTGCPYHAGKPGRPTGPTEADLARNLIGIITGSLGATLRLFTSALAGYAALQRNDGWVAWPTSSTRAPFDEVVADTCVQLRRGGPDSLYRVYVGEAARACRMPTGASSVVTMNPGDLVVTWLGGALKAAGPDFLFGAGKHACPGKDMAQGMIDGILQALYPYKLRVSLEGGDLWLEFSAESFEQLQSATLPVKHAVQRQEATCAR